MNEYGSRSLTGSFLFRGLMLNLYTIIGPVLE